MDDSQRPDGADLAAAVREEFAVVLEVPAVDIGPDADFYHELDGDSLQKLEIAARLEERFGLKLVDDEVADLTTVRGYSALIAAKLARNPAR